MKFLRGLATVGLGTSIAISSAGEARGKELEGKPPSEEHGRLTCSEIEKTRTRSFATYILPPVCRTLIADAGGIRSTLAEHGIGFQSLWVGSVDYDLSQRNHGPQSYGGQDATGFSGLVLIATYDMSRLGLPENSQLTLALSDSRNSYFKTQRYKNLTAFSMHHSFADNAVELQYGYIELSRVTGFGAFGGGAAQDPFGPTASVLLQAGLSSLTPAPAAMLTLKNPNNHLYNKAAVTRSTHPLGLDAEQDKNPYGVKWSVPGGDMLYLDELGYKRPSSRSSNALWMMLGGVYNTSDYNSLDLRAAPSTDRNWAIYGGVSAQLSNPHSDPRGTYIGAKFNRANEHVNSFYSDYSVSLFKIGTLESRPQDVASLTWSQSDISRDLTDTIRSFGGDAADDTTSMTATYSYSFHQGIYFVGSLSYVTNPTITPTSKDALIGKFSMTVAF